MRWVAVADLDDTAMIRFAIERTTVRLDDGRIVTLIGWPGPGHLRSRRGRYARLENANGSHFTLHVRRVTDVDVDDG